MLILTRKVGETIIVNEETTIMVTAIKGDKVRLGIKTKSLYNVRRGELPPLENESAAIVREAGEQPPAAEAATCETGLPRKGASGK